MHGVELQQAAVNVHWAQLWPQDVNPDILLTKLTNRHHQRHSHLVDAQSSGVSHGCARCIRLHAFDCRTVAARGFVTGQIWLPQSCAAASAAASEHAVPRPTAAPWGVALLGALRRLATCGDPGSGSPTVTPLLQSLVPPDIVPTRSSPERAYVT